MRRGGGIAGNAGAAKLSCHPPHHCLLTCIGTVGSFVLCQLSTNKTREQLLCMAARRGAAEEVKRLILGPQPGVVVAEAAGGAGNVTAALPSWSQPAELAPAPLFKVEVPRDVPLFSRKRTFATAAGLGPVVDDPRAVVLGACRALAHAAAFDAAPVISVLKDALPLQLEELAPAIGRAVFEAACGEGDDPGAMEQLLQYPNNFENVSVSIVHHPSSLPSSFSSPLFSQHTRVLC